jgi:hypothetical protein
MERREGKTKLKTRDDAEPTGQRIPLRNRLARPELTV